MRNELISEEMISFWQEMVRNENGLLTVSSDELEMTDISTVLN